MQRWASIAVGVVVGMTALLPASAMRQEGLCGWEECVLSPVAVSLSESGLPRACQSRWENLAQLPVIAFTEGFREMRVLVHTEALFSQILRIHEETDCQVPMGWARARELDARLRESCRQASAALAAETNPACPWCRPLAAEACIESFFAYRFEIVRAAVGERPLSSITDKRTVVALFFAEAIRESKSLEKIRAVLQRTVELDPSDRDTMQQLLDVTYALWLASSSAPIRSRWEEEFEDLFRATRHRFGKEKHFSSWLALARMHGDAPEMEKIATSMLQESPENETGIYYLAWAQFLRGNVVEASRLLRQLITYEYSSPYHHQAAIGIKRLLSRDPQARLRPAFFEEELNAGFALTLSHRTQNFGVAGVVLSIHREESDNRSLPEVKEAIAERAESRELRTDREDDLHAAVRLALRERKWKEASSVAAQWLALNPWSRAAFTVSQEAFWTFVFHNSPRDLTNMVRLGGLLTREGRYEEGIAVLKRARAHASTRLGAASLIDWAERMGGRETQLREAVKGSPRSESARFALASFLLERRRLDEAESELKQLFQLNPEHFRGRRMHSTIISLRAVLGEPATVDTMISRFFAEERSRFIAEASPFNEEQERWLDEITRDRIVAKYRLRSSHVGHLPTETEAAQTWWEVRSAEERDAKRAESLHRARMGRFPASSQATIGFVHFLIKEDRVDEAEEELRAAQERFPGEIGINILKDRLQDVRSASSEEQSELAKEALWRDLLVWKSFLADNSRGLPAESDHFRIAR